jgi:hypothetical protein
VGTSHGRFRARRLALANRTRAAQQEYLGRLIRGMSESKFDGHCYAGDEAPRRMEAKDDDIFTCIEEARRKCVSLPGQRSRARPVRRSGGAAGSGILSWAAGLRRTVAPYLIPCGPLRSVQILGLPVQF